MPRPAMRLLYAGMIMSACGLLQENPKALPEEQIRHGLEGNLCRCTSTSASSTP